MNNKLAVIIPVFNTEKYLKKCLDSVIHQTLQEIEIICVNDGSTDNSGGILKQYAQKDKRIKIVTKENGGLSSARNAGLNHVTSEYVTFVDSDDWVDSNVFKEALEIVKNKDFDMVCWGAKIECEDNIKNSPNIEEAKKYHSLKYCGAKYLTDEVLSNTTVTVWNKLFKTSIIKDNNIQFPQKLLYEDNEFFLTYALHCKKIYFIDKYLYHYFQRKNSIIASAQRKSSNKSLDYIKIYENIYNYYKEQKKLSDFSTTLSKKFDDILYNSYPYAANELKAKKEFKKLVNNLNNQILKNHAIDLIRQNKFYEIPNLNAELFGIGGKLFKFAILKHRIIIRLFGIKLSLTYEKIFHIKKEEDRKIIIFLGIKIKLKNKKAQNNVQWEANEEQPGTYEISKLYLKEILNKNPQEKTEYQHNNFTSTIHSMLSQLEHFYFYPNVGNMGDGIIAEAEYQILNSNPNCSYTIVDNYCNTFNPQNDFALLYGGGGLFVKYWDYTKALNIFKAKNLKQCIILPSSFYECDDVIRCFDERFTVFCREKNSYTYCTSKNNKAKFILTDDIAFSLNLSSINAFDRDRVNKNLEKITAKDLMIICNKIYPKIQKLQSNIKNALIKKTIINAKGLRIGLLLRNDAEGTFKTDALDSFDLSKFANSPYTDSGVSALYSLFFVNTLKTFDVIVTNRLHIGIVSSLLGKEVYLIDNSYKKVSGVYENSMQHFEKTKIIQSIHEFSIDNTKTESSCADLEFLNTSITFKDFLAIYLSKLRYEKNVKTTIWSVE